MQQSQAALHAALLKLVNSRILLHWSVQMHMQHSLVCPHGTFMPAMLTTHLILQLPLQPSLYSMNPMHADDMCTCHKQVTLPSWEMLSSLHKSLTSNL